MLRSLLDSSCSDFPVVERTRASHTSSSFIPRIGYARDDPGSYEYEGIRPTHPTTTQPEALSPSFIKSRLEHLAFEASQKAASYTQIANRFEENSRKHFLIAQASAENAKGALRTVRRSAVHDSLTSDAMVNLRGYCYGLKKFLVGSDRKPDFEKLSHESLPMLKMRSFCGELERELNSFEFTGGFGERLYAEPTAEYPREAVWPPGDEGMVWR